MMESLVLTLGNIKTKGINVSMDGNGKVSLDLNVKPAVVTAAPNSAAGTVTARPVIITETGTQWDGDSIVLAYNWSSPDSGEFPNSSVPHIGDVGVIIDSKYFVPFHSDNTMMEDVEYIISSSTDGTIVVSNTAVVPVGLITSNNNYYPIEKGSLEKTTEGWVISIANYLAYDNTAEFTPTWKVYCAGGGKGEDGLNFNPDVKGLEAELSTYNDEDKGFTFFALDTHKFFFKLSDASGDWSTCDLKPEKGKDGKDGTDGKDGKDGITYTPIINDETGELSWENDGNLPNPPTIRVVGRDGADGKNGADGTDGEDGANGVTYTPHVDEDGLLTWTNDGGLENPQQINIKGPEGADGKDGITPNIGENLNWYIGGVDTGVRAAGLDGDDGKDGKDGSNGADGTNGVTFTPSVSEDGTVSWTNDGGLENPPSINIKGEVGKDGTDGIDGADGADGITPHIGANGNWFIGSTDTGVHARGDKGESGVVTNFVYTVPVTDVQNNTIVIPQDLLSPSNNETIVALPTHIIIDGGPIVYPLEKGSMLISGNTVTVDVSPYLVYENKIEANNSYTLIFCGGIKGEPGTVTVYVGDTAPANPTNGMIWIDTNN